MRGDALELLESYARGVVDGTSDAPVFPFSEVASSVAPTWQAPARQLFANWLGEVTRRADLAR